MKKFLLTAVCALILVSCLTGCGQQKVDAQPTAQPAAQTDSPADVQQTEEPLDPELVPVETKFGTLYYNEQWSEFMKTEIEETDNSVEVRFIANINKTDFPLFTVSVGSGSGAESGKLTGPDGVQREVLVLLQEVDPGNALTEDQINRLYAMQEDVNFVLDHLK